MDWNFNLATICREHEFVFFDTGGLDAPVHNSIDQDLQKQNVERFVNELRLASYWKVPHAVYDEMLSRTQDNPNLNPLVELLKEHTHGLGEKTKAARYICAKSIEAANKFAVPEYDRVALSYAIVAATIAGKKTALITKAGNAINAFRELRSEIGTDPEKAIAYKLNGKGVYAPVLEPVRIL